MYKDVYVFWLDRDEGICKSYKTSVPTDTMSSWTRTAFWGGAARFVWELGDGFQPADLAALMSGYWLKEYHNELEEDLKMIEGDMNLLGAPGEDEKQEL